MAAEHSRHRAAEEVAAQLQWLPHLAADHAVDAHAGRMDAALRPYGEVLPLFYAVAAAGDGAPAAWRAAAASAPGHVEISRRHQSQHPVDLGLSAEDDAARDGQVDPCHRHGICLAAADDRAA